MSEIVRELSEAEYQSAFSAPMVDVTQSASEVVELWPYAENAMREAFPTACSCDWDVSSIYETPEGTFQHVLFPSHISNTYLVIIINKVTPAILGYYKLDLGALYGVNE